MIIDFHTHIFPEKIASKTIAHLENLAGGHASTDGTIEGLLTNMKRGGCDIGITLPVLTKATQFDSVTRFALEVNQIFAEKSYPKLISFGGMHPECEDIYGKMQYLKDNGIKGVKIHPDYQNTFIDDPGYIKILECAKEMDLIVVTHAGVDDGYIGQPVKCPPELTRKVIDKVGHSKFVLAHYGGSKQWEDVYNLIAGDDVYLDTAFTFNNIDKDMFMKILSKHGEDKVLFATDCPWRDIGEDVNILKSFGLSLDTLDKIFYKNAIKLLGL